MGTSKEGKRAAVLCLSPCYWHFYKTPSLGRGSVPFLAGAGGTAGREARTEALTRNVSSPGKRREDSGEESPPLSYLHGIGQPWRNLFPHERGSPPNVENADMRLETLDDFSFNQRSLSCQKRIVCSCNFWKMVIINNQQDSFRPGSTKFILKSVFILVRF